MSPDPAVAEVNRRSLRIFLLTAFLPAWLLFLAPLLLGDQGEAGRRVITIAAWSAAMWMPGIAALAATRWGEGKPLRELNLGRLGRRRFYVYGWLIPILSVLVVGLLTWLLGLGEFESTFPVIRQSLEQIPEGTVLSPALLLAAQLGLSLTLAPLINTLFALGEELGWRGYLLPQLLPLGHRPAVLLSGICWGVWHLPAILQGHNYPGRPILGTFLMILFCVLLGTFFSWLYLETRSPWAPALSHGTVNAVGALPLLFLSGVDIIRGGTLASLTGLLTLSLLAGALVLTRQFPKET